MTPLLLGHRGARASRHILENTLASFELCLQHGCDGFEFDVRRSADGVAVVCHDPVVRGLALERTLAADLELPTLEDVLHRFGAGAFLDIELKVGGLEARTIAALRERPPGRGHVVSSFLPEVLRTVRGLDSHVPLGFICDEREKLALWRDVPGSWVIPHFELLDRQLVEECHSAGKAVMVWTVNRPDAMREFAEWGVDAIISDETELLARAVRATGGINFPSQT